MSYTRRYSGGAVGSSTRLATAKLRPAAKRQSVPLAAASASARDSGAFSIIVHSHLCWDWVWQRPQQFMSRLSQRHPILFVETVGPDPELVTPTAWLSIAPNYPNVRILRVQFPTWRWADGAYVDAARLRIVEETLAGPLAGIFERPVQWYYDPMAVTAFGGRFDELATVYDCMDELAQFRFAPPELKDREISLMARADLVFTGGRRLYEAKSRRHSNCHFYGCGVDLEHFGRARAAETSVPADLLGLGRPVLGYFGVIDERMDYELLARLADSNPDWSIAMVGPVTKVDERSLPRRANLHWLGKRDYTDLPGCAKAFDVCLMPFARNEATEYINPTKALEYMATGRPIVSTAIPDVISNFSEVVQVASTPAEFVDHCRAALKTPDRAAIERGLQMASENTWDRIVAALERHVLDVLEKRAGQPVGQPQTPNSISHGAF